MFLVADDEICKYVHTMHCFMSKLHKYSEKNKITTIIYFGILDFRVDVVAELNSDVLRGICDIFDVTQLKFKFIFTFHLCTGSDMIKLHSESIK